MHNRVSRRLTSLHEIVVLEPQRLRAAGVGFSGGEKGDYSYPQIRLLTMRTTMHGGFCV